MEAKSLLSSPVVAALVAILGGVLTVTAPRILDFFSRRTRRLNAIEFAKKRVEFWNDFLKVEREGLAVLGGDQERVAMETARAGIARARNDASVELRRLQWRDEEIRAVWGLTFGRRTKWYVLFILSGFAQFAVGAIGLLTLLRSVLSRPVGPLPPPNTKFILTSFACMTALAFILRLLEQAKTKVLKISKPDSPLMAEI